MTILSLIKDLLERGIEIKPRLGKTQSIKYGFTVKLNPKPEDLTEYARRG